MNPNPSRSAQPPPRQGPPRPAPRPHARRRPARATNTAVVYVGGGEIVHYYSGRDPAPVELQRRPWAASLIRAARRPQVAVPLHQSTPRHSAEAPGLAIRQRLHGDPGQARVRQSFLRVVPLDSIPGASTNFLGTAGTLGWNALSVRSVSARCPTLARFTPRALPVRTLALAQGAASLLAILADGGSNAIGERYSGAPHAVEIRVGGQQCDAVTESIGGNQEIEGLHANALSCERETEFARLLP
jgi:hypothetical protein